MDALLFGAAGRLDWLAAWVLSLAYLAFLLIAIVWATRNAPDLLEERGRMAANVKTWDKVVGAIYTVLLLALLVTAGLDAGRFRWSAMPMVVQALGAIGLAPAGAVIMWSMTSNAFLSRWARIQDDRGHVVVEGGPYRFVRHPMYAGIMLLMICVSLGLGSWYALIPAGLVSALYIIRTALEDRMLRDELPGYREYASRVRYRLVPRLW